jgi:hypothetical protein
MDLPQAIEAETLHRVEYPRLPCNVSSARGTGATGRLRRRDQIRHKRSWWIAAIPRCESTTTKIFSMSERIENGPRGRAATPSGVR